MGELSEQRLQEISQDATDEGVILDLGYVGTRVQRDSKLSQYLDSLNACTKELPYQQCDPVLQHNGQEPIVIFTSYDENKQVDEETEKQKGKELCKYQIVFYNLTSKREILTINYAAIFVGLDGGMAYFIDQQDGKFCISSTEAKLDSITGEVSSDLGSFRQLTYKGQKV